MIGKLQYISQGDTKEEHLYNIKQVCEWGCNWIQLRLKNTVYDEFLEAALQAKQICEKHNSTLIINDNIRVAKEINADGVHLGKQDAKPADARKILGKDKIIGGTANSYDDIVGLIRQKVNYVGLGPFRFTQTKKNLSPVLGLQGYSKILETLKDNGFDIPVVAIGGIIEDDIELLMKTGIHGVAVSGLLSGANTLIHNSENIYSLLK